MSRLIILVLLSAFSAHSLAGLISYDYQFNYYDITDCHESCSPEAQSGSGELLVDKSANQLRRLSLDTDHFIIDWQGAADISYWNEPDWPLDDGELYYAQTGISQNGYSMSMLLDLFFVPMLAHPLDYLENVRELDHYVENGVASWQLVGHFTKNGTVSVPEPGTLLLLLTGTGLLARRSWFRGLSGLRFRA